MHGMTLRCVVHLEREHGASAQTERGAKRELHHVGAGRCSTNQRSELSWWCMQRVETRRLLGWIILRLAYEQGLRSRCRCGGRIGRGRSRRCDCRLRCSTGRWRHFGVDQHMVHHFPRAGHELNRLDPLVFGESRGDFEILILDGARGRHGKVLLHRHHGIRRAQFPAARIDRLGRQRLHITFLGATVNPAQNGLLLEVGEATVIEERAVRPFRVPRRHEARLHRVFDLADVGLGTVVVEQRERAEPAGSVAGRAILVENGGDIFREHRRHILRHERCTALHRTDAKQCGPAYAEQLEDAGFAGPDP